MFPNLKVGCCVECMHCPCCLYSFVTNQCFLTFATDPASVCSIEQGIWSTLLNENIDRPHWKYLTGILLDGGDLHSGVDSQR